MVGAVFKISAFQPQDPGSIYGSAKSLVRVTFSAKAVLLRLENESTSICEDLTYDDKYPVQEESKTLICRELMCDDECPVQEESKTLMCRELMCDDECPVQEKSNTLIC